MSIEDFETKIKEKLGALRGSAVALPKGGFAYVREPSQKEYMNLQAQSDASHDIYVPLFAQYIKACFLGACDGDGNELSFDDVRAQCGSAFVVSGPLGDAVNRLAGQRKVATRDL